MISCHSKLLLVDRETSITISEASVPVIVSLPGANAAVTTHDPAGIGDDANNGFTTVVAPSGACPDPVRVFVIPKALSVVSKAQYPCLRLSLTVRDCVLIRYDLRYVLKPMNDATVPVKSWLIENPLMVVSIRNLTS